MAKYAALVSTASEGAVTTGSRIGIAPGPALMAEAGAAARVSIGFKTSPQGVDWPTLDATWARAGELEVFDSGWMNDHITDPTLDRGGSSWEALTALAALVHHVPGPDGRPRRPLEHVPPSRDPRQGRDRPRPRDRRPVRPRPRAPAGTRASTCRSASRCHRSGSASTASNRPFTRSRRCSATPPPRNPASRAPIRSTPSTVPRTCHRR